ALAASSGHQLLSPGPHRSVVLGHPKRYAPPAPRSPGTPLYPSLKLSSVWSSLGLAVQPRTLRSRRLHSPSDSPSGRRKSGVFGIDSVLAGLGHGLDVSRVVAFVSSLGSRSMGGGLPMLRDRWPGVWFRCAARCRWRRLGGRAGAGGIPPGQ